MEDISMKSAKLRISQDGMEAYLRLEPPEAGEGYTLAELERFVRSQRVTAEVDEAVITDMITNGTYMKEVCVARGQAPVNGTNGRFDYRFNTNLSSRPVVREDGSVDYWNLNTVEMVQEGQVIAVYIPPQEAVNGMNVLGKPMIAVRGKPLAPLHGKGFHCEEDGCTYVADLTGKIEVVNGQIRISSVYEISGNVGLATGNIDYRGDVVIHGGVESGATVRTSGSLTIDGICENCTIEASKDIILRSGVLGGNKTTIRSGGNVHAKFFEYCRVEAKGYIEVEYALDCRMVCYDHLYLTGKKGLIIGGYAYATTGIDAIVIGNSTEVPTRVHVGASAEMVKEQADHQKAMSEISELIAKITAGLKQYDELAAKKGIDVSKEKKRVELLRIRMMKQAELATHQKELARLSAIIDRSAGATVSVLRSVYAGTVVSIDQNTLMVKEQQDSLKFQKKNDGIVMVSLV